MSREGDFKSKLDARGIPWVEVGPCLLVNGDCLSVLPLLEAGSVDAVVTDPPYGHNNNNNGDLIHRWEAALGRGKHGPSRAIQNDGAEANDIFRSSLREFNRVLSSGCCCCCCCCGGGPDPQFARWSLWMDDEIGFKQMVVWDKGPMGMGWHYRRSYETVLVAEKPGAKCRWFDETDSVENIIRPYGRIRKIIPKANNHPTEKPVELAEHFIRLHTERGHLVLDSFMGHGWAGMACVAMERRFIGIEIEERYFQIAEKRIRQAWQEKRSELPFEKPEPPMQQEMFQPEDAKNPKNQ